MLEWQYPWMLLLGPLPWLMRFAPAWVGEGDIVRVPFLARLLVLAGQPGGVGAQARQPTGRGRLLLWVVWMLLVCAAMRPQWIGAAVEQHQSGRDLMIALDLSGSMAAKDLTGADGEPRGRLDAAKQLLRDLADDSPKDRLGLIVFGSAAYLQAPFTDDHRVWLRLLQDAEIGMAGQRTVFGDAIGLAVKLFMESAVDHRVLVILTDGNDTGSLVPPVEAAKVAAARGIRIYIIAIGNPESQGEASLDLDTLQRISDVTHGRYFRAFDERDLREAYRVIGDLEPAQYEVLSYRPVTDLHWIPAGLAMLVYLAGLLPVIVGAARRRATLWRAQ